MVKQKQLTIRMNEDLYEMARSKCSAEFGIGLSPLIKVFLRAFVSQRGVGFYVGDEDLCNLFSRWLTKKRMDKAGIMNNRFYGPYLRDLYNLADINKR